MRPLQRRYDRNMRDACEPVPKAGRPVVRAGAFLCIALALTACGGEPATPEEEIRALIERTAGAAADGDAGAVADALHPDYRDARGNDRAAIVRLLRLQLLRGGSVVVLPDIEQVEVHGSDAARVRMTVRFAGADLGRLSLDAGARRVELDLVRDDEWRVISARWARLDRTLR
jgi:hypothetical protein